MGVEQVLALSPRRFWFLSNQVARLRAEADLQLLQILGASQSTQEGYQAVFKSLEEQRGAVYVWTKALPTQILLHEETGEEMDPEFDRAGFAALKARVSGAA